MLLSCFRRCRYMVRYGSIRLTSEAVGQMFSEAGGFAYEAMANTAASVAAQAAGAARLLKSSFGMDQWNHGDMEVGGHGPWKNALKRYDLWWMWWEWSHSDDMGSGRLCRASQFLDILRQCCLKIVWDGAHLTIAWLQWAAGNSLADGEWRTAAHLEPAAFSPLNQMHLYIVHICFILQFLPQCSHRCWIAWPLCTSCGRTCHLWKTKRFDLSSGQWTILQPDGPSPISLWTADSGHVWLICSLHALETYRCSTLGLVHGRDS